MLRFFRKQGVEDFVRPKGGRQSGVAILEPMRHLAGHRSIFVRKAPSQNDRCVEDEPAHLRPSLIKSLILRPPKDSRLRFPKFSSRSTASATEPF